MSVSILSSSVGSGHRAANRASDVRTVQHLFNLVDGNAALPENGHCSPALVARIARFQRDVLHYPHPDSRVDPNGRTIQVLLANASRKGAGRRTPTPSTDTSWSQWAASKWSSLSQAMEGAWSSLFAERSTVRRVNSPTPGGRSAGAGAVPTRGNPTQIGVTDQDYVNAAAQLGSGIDPLLVRACAQVESGGKSGFGPAGLPIIAYEGHWFQKYTHHHYDETHPLLSYRYKKKAGWQWQKNNKDQTTAWKTLNEAMELNAAAALKATSWGMCQVMGFNYESCGYKDVFAFVEAMKQGSLGQLQAFVGYCKGRPGMIAALRRKDFAAMAYAYNGKDYGDYDKRFERAYKRLGGKV